MYTNEFIDLVNFSYVESEKFYNEKGNNKNTAPNPFYIGFGNPNSEIVIFGKEKGFKATELTQLKYESINNPTEWKSYIDKETFFDKERYQIPNIPYEHYKNSFYPYKGNHKGGHTWNKYQKLMRNIYPDIKFDECDFFKECFISEVNHNPSKLSEINSHLKLFKNRSDLLKHDFYKKKVIILACGNYLNEDDIENLFDVRHSKNDSSSEHNRKFEIFKNQRRILVNTRQLSFNVSDDYLMKIAKIAKEYL